MRPESYLLYRIAWRLVLLSGGFISLILIVMMGLGLFLSGDDGQGLGFIGFLAIMCALPVLFVGLLTMGIMRAVSALSAADDRSALPALTQVKTPLEKVATLCGYAALPGLFVLGVSFLQLQILSNPDIDSLFFSVWAIVSTIALMVTQWATIAWFLLTAYNYARKSSRW